MTSIISFATWAAEGINFIEFSNDLD